MQNLNLKLTLLLLMAIFISCNSNSSKNDSKDQGNSNDGPKSICDKYVGKWESVKVYKEGHEKISITKDGASYKVVTTVGGGRDGSSVTFVAPCTDGTLKDTKGRNISYSESSDEIYYGLYTSNTFVREIVK